MVELFSYRIKESFLHKFNPGFKLCVLFVLCFITFWGNEITTATMIRVSICGIICVLLFLFSGFYLDSIKRTRFVFFLGFLLTLFKMISFSFADGDFLEYEVVFKIKKIYLLIDVDGLYSGILYTVRFFITALSAEVIFETTSGIQIKNSIEELQNKVARFFPLIKKWNPALVISLAINFIPEVFSTWNKVHKAALSRTDKKSRKNLIVVINMSMQELQTLISCLLYQAENKRKALLNRS